MSKGLILSGFILSLCRFACAQETWFFTEGTDATYYDQGIVDVPNLGESTFEYTYPPGSPQWNDKIPCSTIAWDGFTSLKFNYTSSENGNWQVSIFRNDWSVTDISTLDSLSFYLFSDNAIPASALPLIGFRANKKGEPGDGLSQLYALNNYNENVAAGQWTRIRLPLNIVFSDVNNETLNFSEVKGVVFNQSESNGSSRLILIDNIFTYKSIDIIPVAKNLSATGYDSHVELNWDMPWEGLTYRILASFDKGQSFELRTETTNNYFLDFVPEQHKNHEIDYSVITLALDRESEPVEITSETREFSDEELKDMVQRYSFRYFWQGAHQASGMAMERSNGNGITVASGASGMGLMAMIVAYDREYEPREEIKDRILKILYFLKTCERHHGAWSHWYNGDTYQTQPFTPDDDGGDIVETSYVAQGLLALRNYFSETDEKSVLIQENATQLWESIDWEWYRNYNQNVLFWHWSPSINFGKNMTVTGWSEALSAYIMAASSPTHSIPKEVYEQGWARNGDMVNNRTFYNNTINLSPDWGGPLFWLHYSHLGINPRGLSDQYGYYWTEHINTVRIHHTYAIDNPLNHKNYSDYCWGLSASDDPYDYTAHQPWSNDNGTISPTAALASMPYAPIDAMKALKYFYHNRGSELFGIYGPYDAFNDNHNWVQEAYIGIDQGPIVIMIENQRTGLLWNYVMKDLDLQTGLKKLGFTYQTSNIPNQQSSAGDIKIYPNPAQTKFTIIIPDKIQGQLIVLKLFTMEGKMIRTQTFHPFVSTYSFNCQHLPDGLYLVETITESKQYKLKLLIKN